MVQSMTGFGKAEAIIKSKKIVVELRALNSKTLDLNLKYPEFLGDLDLLIRKNVSNKLIKGKIDLIINIEKNKSLNRFKINTEIVKDYINQLNSIKKDTTNNYINIAVKLPDSLSKLTDEFNKNDLKRIFNLINKAINRAVKFRLYEGKSISKSFKLQIKKIENALKQIKKLEKSRIFKIKRKIKSSLKELKLKVDQNRFEQELIYYIEKYDFSEEIDRLDSHLNLFKLTLNDNSNNGKKLGFIVQEIGREINTIGSKANDSKIQKFVVDMKDNLEKIKEQIYNII